MFNNQFHLLSYTELHGVLVLVHTTNLLVVNSYKNSKKVSHIIIPQVKEN